MILSNFNWIKYHSKILKDKVTLVLVNIHFSTQTQSVKSEFPAQQTKVEMKVQRSNIFPVGKQTLSF